MTQRSIRELEHAVKQLKREYVGPAAGDDVKFEIEADVVTIETPDDVDSHPGPEPPGGFEAREIQVASNVVGVHEYVPAGGAEPDHSGQQPNP